MAKVTVSKKPAAVAKPAAKSPAKKAAVVADVAEELDDSALDDLLDGATEVDPEEVLEEEILEEEHEVITTPPPKRKGSAAPVPAPKAKSAPVAGKVEGLSSAIKESGIISFSEGSGSQGILILISKYGFDREKVLKAANASEKFKAKYFSNCDPVKKYGKMAGIIKKLQDEGYKLPKVGA
jgi:hypothetical protein